MSSIGAVRCTVDVPADDSLPRGTVDRVRAAVGEPLPDALARSLAVWDDVDPASIWVLRTVRAGVLVPASDPTERLAERLAAGVAAAVERALRTGLGTEVIRFASRAEHVAAFVAALAAGAGDAWAFDRFDGLRLLAPLTALRTAARAAPCDVSEVVVELARVGGLDRVVARATAHELTRTWAACCVEHAAVPLQRDRAAAWLARSADSAPPIVAGEPPAGRALRWLGAVGRARPLDAEAVGAVLALTGPPPGARPRAPGPPDRDLATGGAAVDAATGAERLWRELGDDGGHDAGAVVFGARGAPVFLTLPSFAAVGAEALGTAARGAVLALAIGVDADDPAIALAAGDDADGDPTLDADGVTDAVLRALADDDRLDLGTVVAERWRPPDATATVWVARDVATDTWLAAATGDHDRPPARWRELLGVVGARPTIAGEVGGVDALDLAHLTRRRDTEVVVVDDDRLSAAVAARAALRNLARRLLGFERSTVVYLGDRFLTPGGIVSDDGNAVLVELPSPPLQVVLTMAGLDAFAYRVPWLDRDIVVSHAEARP